MNKHIYEKIALTNMRKNGKIYLPYILTVIGSLMFYFFLTSIGSNPNIYDLSTGKEAFQGAMTLCGIIQSAAFAISFFVFIFLLYANSFVLKHQKKQMGLYRVLGMERKHIIRVIALEVVLVFLVGIVAGLFGGILFDKLMLVLLFKMIGQTAPAGFYVNTNAIVMTLMIAGVTALFILIRSVFSILLTKDIDLLKSEKTGEKEPKNRPIYTIVGVICLGIGYYIALTCKSAGEAINNFFPASLLVMYATYVLFTTGSIFLLKMLKNNKNYYYKTKHFISVSGMIYRMKQNAAGLATICILSTAAIIVLSAGVSLYANGEYGINEQFPREVKFYTEMNSGEDVEMLVQKTVEEKKFEMEDMLRCSYANVTYVKTETGLEMQDEFIFQGFENMPDTFVLTLEEYNRFYGGKYSDVTLEKNEILLYASDDFYTGKTLTFADETYEVKDEADKECLKYIAHSSMSLFSKLLIIVPNEEVLGKFIASDLSNMVTWVGFNSSQNREQVLAFAEILKTVFSTDDLLFDISVKQEEQDYFYSMYGGILFIGLIIGILFIISTAMIIYYKQISEGYEDRERFIIMQKVGLSKEEVKKAIHSQVMSVFFLPLIVAFIHSAVALNIVANCLKMVVVIHVPTFMISVMVTCVVFALVYAIVYKITSKEYYKIVNE